MKTINGLRGFLLVMGMVTLLSANALAKDKGDIKNKVKLPSLREKAILTESPAVPPAITRRQPAIVEVYLNSSVKRVEIKSGVTYDYWTFNDLMPGPFIRVRQGDILEIHHTNTDARYAAQY